MEYELMNENELQNQRVGVAITVGSVMAIAMVLIAIVVVIKLLFSNDGGVTVPGGWKFSWIDEQNYRITHLRKTA